MDDVPIVVMAQTVGVRRASWHKRLGSARMMAQTVGVRARRGANGRGPRHGTNGWGPP